MRKKIHFGRLSALALALTLITTCLMGGTLAKYTSTVKGSGKATVAKWKVSIKANGNEQTADFNFDLEDTGTNKSNVKTGVVAPGSTGSIPIEIDAQGSEVAAKLTYTIDKSSIGDVPIKFYSDANYSTEITWTDNKYSDSKTVAQGASADDSKLAAEVFWRWDTASEDAADTVLGKETTAKTGTISITLTAEQDIVATTP